LSTILLAVVAISATKVVMTLQHPTFLLKGRKKERKRKEKRNRERKGIPKS
jgi:hypothetical protein